MNNEIERSGLLKRYLKPEEKPEVVSSEKPVAASPQRVPLHERKNTFFGLPNLARVRKSVFASLDSAHRFDPNLRRGELKLAKQELDETVDEAYLAAEKAGGIRDNVEFVAVDSDVDVGEPTTPPVPAENKAKKPFEYKMRPQAVTGPLKEPTAPVNLGDEAAKAKIAKEATIEMEKAHSRHIVATQGLGEGDQTKRDIERSAKWSAELAKLSERQAEKLKKGGDAYLGFGAAMGLLSTFIYWKMPESVQLKNKQSNLMQNHDVLELMSRFVESKAGSLDFFLSWFSSNIDYFIATAMKGKDAQADAEIQKNRETIITEAFNNCIWLLRLVSAKVSDQGKDYQVPENYLDSVLKRERFVPEKNKITGYSLKSVGNKFGGQDKQAKQ